MWFCCGCNWLGFALLGGDPASDPMTSGKMNRKGGFDNASIGTRFGVSGARVQGSGFQVQGSGFRVQVSGFRVQVSGFRVQGSGFRVQGSGFQGSGFRV